MKNIFKLILLAAGMVFIYSSCSKIDNLHKSEALPVYQPGVSPVLTSSVNTIAAAVADSDKTVVSLNWTNPQYASDSNANKYVIQFDSSGRNFAQAVSFTVLGKLNNTFTAKEINAFLLGFGFAFNTAYDVDVRVVSSYGNNNEQYKSNVLKLKMTPYLIPPKVVPPASKTLFLVGSATAGGWGNPVPAPAQKFTRVDSVTYQGTFFLNGGGEYLLLPVNGSWSTKFAVADKNLAGLNTGGKFGFNDGSANPVYNDNVPGPVTTGMYKITVDFQQGKFNVVPVGTYGLLYVPGDYQGWTPSSAPSLGSPKNDGEYDGYINIPAGGSNEFKFTTSPDWTNAIGDGGNGTLVPGGGGNMKVPGAGYYHITASTTDKKWSATATTWGIIGSFAASGWGSDVDMVYSASDNKWTGTITTAAGDMFKFRGNHDWGLNYGDSDGSGKLIPNGENIGDASKNFSVPAGTHTITLLLNNSGYYTYSIE